MRPGRDWGRNVDRGVEPTHKANPVGVVAVQWRGDRGDLVAALGETWCGRHVSYIWPDGSRLDVTTGPTTPEGDTLGDDTGHAWVGDWVVVWPGGHVDVLDRARFAVLFNADSGEPF